VEALEKKTKVVTSQVRDVAGKDSNIFQLLHSCRKGDSDVSHSNFEISPIEESRLLADCKFGTVLQWAKEVLLEAYETRQADVAIRGFQSSIILAHYQVH